MDYWDKYFGTGSPVFQVSADDEEVEELRSEKSVKSGKVSLMAHSILSLHFSLFLSLSPVSRRDQEILRGWEFVWHGANMSADVDRPEHPEAERYRKLARSPETEADGDTGKSHS